MSRNTLENGLKSFEIGEDSKSKQATKKRHYEQRKSMKRSEMASTSHIQALDDIVELQNNPKTRRTGIISYIFNQRPELIRDRHQGIKLAKEIAKEQKIKKLILKANSVKWRDWQIQFIEKANK